MNNAAVGFAKPSTLRAKVESFLRDAIMEGRIAAGERIKESELSEALGVSRPTIREALRTLEAERLISIEPHKGPTVVSITPKAAREMYALRGLLEGYAAHEFTRLASDQMVERLNQAARRLFEVAEGHDKSELLAAKWAFYEILLEGAENDLAKEFLTALLSRINLLRATSLSDPKRLPHSIAEITRLLERVNARDCEGAQQAARDHIARAEKAALEVLTRQSSAGTEGGPPA